MRYRAAPRALHAGAEPGSADGRPRLSALELPQARLADPGQDVAFEDAPRVSALGDVALGQFEPIQKRLEERDTERACRDLCCAPRVSQDLPSLEPSDVVEEPAAARVHEHRLILQVQKLDRERLLGRIQRAPRVAGEEA